MSRPEVFPLACAVQKYAWGKLGDDSAVAQLAAGGNSEFRAEASAAYAELWMGAHPKAPSSILDSAVQPSNLAAWLQQNPWALSERVASRFQGELPFLFKVLSIRNALSIQAHPNKEHAERLFAKDPTNYPDPNHKPEMAIALTDFKGMCGFRPFAEIASHLRALPDLACATGEAAAHTFAAAVDAKEETSKLELLLRDCFRGLMTSPDATVKTCLAAQLAAIAGQDNRTELDQLFVDLNEQFPGDVGCFCIYFLNVVVLKPGEAIFLAANIPHAYIAGDCIECMACSDNVVRAGLTPKFKDVDTLIAMLDYTASPAQSQVYTGSPDAELPHVTHYASRVEDFGVSACKLAASQSGALGVIAGPSILIVTHGAGTAAWTGKTLPLTKGSVVFAAAGADVTLAAGPDGLELYRAFC